MESLLCKDDLRKELKIRRAGLHNQRHFFAAGALAHTIATHYSTYERVLSFASFGSEISTQKLNNELAKEGRLVLPRVEGEELALYLVKNPEKELIKNNRGLLEPDPTQCELIPYEEITLVLVPGLGFTNEGGRLGYGGGYYDRLLPKLTGALFLGVGFEEQCVPALPLEPHDYLLSELLLF